LISEQFGTKMFFLNNGPIIRPIGKRSPNRSYSVIKTWKEEKAIDHFFIIWL